jgi:hypothetical protein
VRPLAAFAENHPVVAGVVGASSGLAAKALESLHLVATVVADLGMIAGGLVAILSAHAFMANRRRKELEEKAERAYIERRERLERDSGEDFLNHGDE